LKKIPLIDLVRSFSILVVLAQHLQELALLRRPENSWLFWLWDHLWRNGIYGVYCFFVVSGFLITGVIAKNSGGLWKPSVREFYIQRAGRIFPLLVLVLWIGICMLLIPHDINDRSFDIFRSSGGSIGVGFWICILTFTLNWYVAFNPLISYALHFAVLWSLCVEEQFYFLFPQALKRLKNTKGLFRLLMAVIAAGFLWRLACYFFQSNGFLQVWASPGAFDNIAFGVLLYLAVERWKSFLRARQIICWCLCAIGLAVMLSIYLGTWIAVPADRVYASSLLDLGLCVFLLGGLHLSVFESTLWKPLGWPGKYCYGGYLLHPMVIVMLYPLVLRANAWVSYALFSTVTIALAALSYHYFEMPANRLIRQKMGLIA
jgi:peptidoglycan/LPS O-acetylase OafA/YrhL